MADWEPHFVGLAFIAFVIAMMRFFPNAWWSRELRRGYGIRGTAADGSMRRVDFFRGAALCVAIAVALVLLGFGFGVLGEQYPNMSRANWTAAAYMLGCVLLAGVALLCAIIAAWNGLRWRPPQQPQGRDR
jgi:protein-S-isoprenylcysteine O-methyltransferase Ste14